LVRWAAAVGLRVLAGSWLRASSHNVNTTFAPDPRTSTSSIEVDDALRLCARSRSNILLIGSDDEVERAIIAITGLPTAALPVWPPGLEPLVSLAERSVPLDEHESRREWVTVVVRDVQALDATAQEQLNAWLGKHAGTLRVIATAAASLYPMVERREFLESLYYRLNVMCVESARVFPPATHRSASAP
jgi:hypothetical protein